jgi:hypothetical protein
VPDLTALYGEDQEAQQSVEASEEGPLSPTVAQERAAGQTSDELAKLRMDYKDLENKRLEDLAEKDAEIARLQQQIIDMQEGHVKELVLLKDEMVAIERKYLEEKDRYQQAKAEQIEQIRTEYTNRIIDMNARIAHNNSIHARDVARLNDRLNEMYRIATTYSARIDEISHYTLLQRIPPIEKRVDALPAISMKEADLTEDDGIYEVPEEGRDAN